MTRKIGVLSLSQLFVLSCAVRRKRPRTRTIGKQSNRPSGGRANCKAMEITNSFTGTNPTDDSITSGLPVTPSKITTI